MDLNQTFARSVRKLRHELGLSQEELGEQSGLRRNYIGMIERGETSPTLDAVEAIATALRMKWSWFIRQLGGAVKVYSGYII